MGCFLLSQMKLYSTAPNGVHACLAALDIKAQTFITWAGNWFITATTSTLCKLSIPFRSSPLVITKDYRTEFKGWSHS